MNTHTIIPFRNKRCDTLALQLVRESVKASLVASKAEKKLWSRALRALGRTVEIWVATGWAFALFAILAVTLGLMSASVAIGFEIGKWIFHLLTK